MKTVVQLVILFISEFSASSQLYPFCKYSNLHIALRSVPKLRARFKSCPSSDCKKLEKSAYSYTLWLRPKKNSSCSDENWIFGNAEKNAFSHKVFSRVPKLWVGTVLLLLLGRMQKRQIPVKSNFVGFSVLNYNCLRAYSCAYSWTVGKGGKLDWRKKTERGEGLQQQFNTVIPEGNIHSYEYTEC